MRVTDASLHLQGGLSSTVSLLL